MKAITIYQPWASLIAARAKQFETRPWQTAYRGPIAIHAGAKKPSSLLTALDDCLVLHAAKALGLIVAGAYHGVAEVIRLLDKLPRGAIIATATLAECQYTQSRLHEISETEMVSGDWRIGRYAWKLENVELLLEPTQARGQQGLWEWRTA